jgi:hypothetical protein
MNLLASLNLPPIVYTVLGVLQLVFLVHALKTGRGSPWFFILLFLPGIGVLLYLFFELLPNLGYTRTGIELSDKLKQFTNPPAGLSELQERAQTLPTITNLENLADAYVANDRPSDAIPIYRQAIAKEPLTYPDLYRKLARALFATKQYQDAISEWDVVLASDDARADDRVMYARTLEALGKNKQALVFYQKGAPLTTDLSAYYYYGQLLKKLDKKEERTKIVKAANTAYSEFIPRLQRQQKQWLAKINSELGAK